MYTIDNYNYGWQSGDGRGLQFSGPLSSATSGTLSVAWSGSTGTYNIRFSDGTVKTGVNLTHGGTSVSWSGAVTAGAYAGAYTVAGNSTIYVGTDGTHPPQAGHEYLSARIADGVLIAAHKALLSM